MRRDDGPTGQSILAVVWNQPACACRTPEGAERLRDVFGNVRSPNHATLLWGLRVSGKTVLLNAFENRAAEHGWLGITTAAARPKGVIDDSGW